jgi:histidinol-phosphate aminotransferase
VACGRTERRDTPDGQSVSVTPQLMAPVHGGPDDGPAIRIDFSTNAHPLGHNPFVREVVDRADRTRYPDPLYMGVRRVLADFHSVEPRRIVVGASASELIWRLTRCWNAAGGAAIVTDERTFGEYLRAARALNACIAAERSMWPTATPVLQWCCNPDNPSGVINDERIDLLVNEAAGSRENLDVVVADLAYWPFRRLLQCESPAALFPSAPWTNHVVQLWSPNKLHGLTGVRGAYLVLPVTQHPRINPETLNTIAPSWVLGADGIALLQAHVHPEATQFLLETAPTLRAWKNHQDRRLVESGWQSESSGLHYGLWRPPIQPSYRAHWHTRLREEGIKLRDASSFGRPGWVRLVCRAPGDVEELLALTTPFRERT